MAHVLAHACANGKHFYELPKQNGVKFGFDSAYVVTKRGP